MSTLPPSAPVVPSTEAEQQTDIIDVAKLRDYAAFAVHSLRRHRALALSSFMLVVSLSIASMSVLPRTYQVQTVIQALRNPSLPTLANAGLYRPYEADAPTRAARETVLRRDNLVSLIKQTDLEKKWTNERAPAIRFVEWIARRLSGHDRTHDEQIDALIDRLEKDLAVNVNEGSVTITLNWPNPETAVVTPGCTVRRASRSTLSR